MAKQVQMTNSQFKKFVDCEMTKHDYIRHLRSMRIIT
jgi:hypothetical protein